MGVRAGPDGGGTRIPIGDSGEAIALKLAKAFSTFSCVAFNELTREVNDYQWFAATLNVAWPVLGSLDRRAATVRSFVERMGCWELGIDRAQGVEPVVRATDHPIAAGLPSIAKLGLPEEPTDPSGWLGFVR